MDSGPGLYRQLVEDVASSSGLPGGRLQIWQSDDGRSLSLVQASSSGSSPSNSRRGGRRLTRDEEAHECQRLRNTFQEVIALRDRIALMQECGHLGFAAALADQSDWAPNSPLRPRF